MHANADHQISLFPTTHMSRQSVGRHSKNSMSLDPISYVNLDWVWVVLWLHDYLETLPQEIKVIWPQRLSGATILFLLNRHAMILYLVLALFTTVPGTASDSLWVHSHSTWVSLFIDMCLLLSCSRITQSYPSGNFRISGLGSSSRIFRWPRSRPANIPKHGSLIR